MLISRIRASFFAALLIAAPLAAGQAIGPDLISSSHVDITRNGANAAGTMIGYSIGSITCNRGDMDMIVSVANSIRPHVGQGMYRLKTFAAPGGGSYQRFEQVGQGWAKRVGLPSSGSSGTCGACQIGAPQGRMGINCADTYDASFNVPVAMVARSQVNAATGMVNGSTGGGTGELATRLQVPAIDAAGQPAGTRFFIETVHMLPHDATYVRPGGVDGQPIAVNALNNASSQEININNGASNPTLLGGAANQQRPAVTRWRDFDAAVTLVTADHDDTPNPDVASAFIRCRYYVAAKATDLSGQGAGPWRYEYAVYNLNSDRGAGIITLPLPASATFTDYTFRHPPSHSSEAISNAPWAATRDGDVLTFSTEAFIGNPGANAIRWGTLYNFGFTSDAPPMTGAATIGLFKPAPTGGATSIAAPNIPVPGAIPCPADFNGDGARDPDDLADFITCFFLDVQFSGICAAADFNGDGFRDPDDLADFITVFFLGCP